MSELLPEAGGLGSHGHRCSGCTGAGLGVYRKFVASAHGCGGVGTLEEWTWFRTVLFGTSSMGIAGARDAAACPGSPVEDLCQPGPVTRRRDRGGDRRSA